MGGGEPQHWLLADEIIRKGVLEIIARLRIGFYDDRSAELLGIAARIVDLSKHVVEPADRSAEQQLWRGRHALESMSRVVRRASAIMHRRGRGPVTFS